MFAVPTAAERGRKDERCGIAVVSAGSIYSPFVLNRQQQTVRVLRAIDNPCFNVLGHATGRLLLRREGYEVDIHRLNQKPPPRESLRNLRLPEGGPLGKGL